MAGEVGTAPNTGVLESGSVRPVPQLILKNVLHQVPDDPLYLKQLEVLKTAVRSGYRLHVYMKRSDGTEYFTDLIACRIMGDRISAVLPMRPFINGNAEASASNGFFGGSVDTLGTYIWAPYRIGADTLGLRANDKAFQAKIERGDYEISWYIY